MTATRNPAPDESAAQRQRLDKWLWFARVVKTRSLAARLVGEGHVRINAVRGDNPAKLVRVGDVLTVALDRHVRVLKILAPGLRRGPYAEARTLYDDLSSPSAGGEYDEETDGDD
jgi:ribosome-associated heat shock protein Hsp15